MKIMLKKLPVILLAILLALTSASYAAPAAEVEADTYSSAGDSVTEAPMTSAVVEPVAEEETPVSSAVAESTIEAETSMDATEPAAETETLESSVVAEPVAETENSVNSPTESESWEDYVNRRLDMGDGRRRMLYIMPQEEADKLPPSVDLSSVAHAKFVFWKIGDHKMHIDPYCLSMPNNDIPIRGTREQAVVESHDEWCERCCKVMDRNWYEKTGSNNFENWFEKTGNWFLKEDGTGICENSPVDENGMPWYIPYEDTIMP